MRPWVRPRSCTASRIPSVKLPASRSPAFLTQPESCREAGINRKNSDRSVDAPTGRRTLRWGRISSIHMGSYRKGDTNMSGPIRMGCRRSWRERTTATPGGSSALGAVGLCPERYVTFSGVVITRPSTPRASIAPAKRSGSNIGAGFPFTSLATINSFYGGLEPFPIVEAPRTSRPGPGPWRGYCNLLMVGATGRNDRSRRWPDDFGDQVAAVKHGLSTRARGELSLFRRRLRQT